MPWQQEVANLGLELVENSQGVLVPAFREVICTVMRQNGKSTLLFVVQAHRCVLWPEQPQRAIYTAQDGAAARKKLIEDAAPLYTGSRLFNRLVRRVYRGIGYEGIDFVNDSTVRIIGSSDSAGHGNTKIGFAGIDESFADVDFRREQALQPSMATVPDAQIWNVSTAGTERSVYLRKKIDDGRYFASSGVTTGTAYVEYSIPDDADCDDPETWWSHMPSLGWTITEETVAHARQTMPDGEWRRSFGNQWTISDERVIPVDVWEAACSVDVRPEGVLRFGLDVNPDRSAAAVCVGDDSLRGELVEFREGVGWVVDRVVELCSRWGAELALDVNGPAGSLGDELESRGVRVVRYGGREMAYACGLLFDKLADRQVRVRSSDVLDVAVAGAKRRSAGDSWVWARKDASVDVSPLVALTLCLDRGVKKSTEVWVSWD